MWTNSQIGTETVNKQPGATANRTMMIGVEIAGTETGTETLIEEREVEMDPIVKDRTNNKVAMMLPPKKIIVRNNEYPQKILYNVHGWSRPDSLA